MEKKKQLKGFAVMDSETRKRIAGMGGKRAHELGVGHRFTKEEAAKAGRLGGLARRGKGLSE